MTDDDKQQNEQNDDGKPKQLLAGHRLQVTAEPQPKTK
jgi:hypothetical protein